MSINEALFSKNILAYIIFRLRYFSLNVIFTMGVHVLEFYFITIIFSNYHLEHLILFRAGIFVINAGWWGMLEVMLSRIRTLPRTDPKTLACEMGNWQFLALLLGVICALISLIFIFFALNRSPVENFYIAAVLLQLGIHFFVEVRRASIYAKFRIARPFLSIMILPLANVFFLVTFWWLLGDYALAINALCSALLSTVISLHYIHRAYIIHQWPTPIWPTLQEFWHCIPNAFVSEFFWAGLASILISLEGIIIWLIYYENMQSGVHNTYYKLLYFISPLLNTSATCGRLFYFDNKKYNDSLLKRCMPSFNARRLHLTPFICLFYWLITALFCIGYFQENTYSFSLLLLVFFVLRSSMAYLQIVSFSKRYYRDVILICLIILCSLIGFIAIQSLLGQVI